MVGVVMTCRPYFGLAPALNAIRWLTGSTLATLAGSCSNTGHPATGVPSLCQA